MDELKMNTTMEEYLCQKATMAKIPLGGTFELTPLCNMSCDMCYIRMTREEMQQEGNMLSVEEWLVIAKEMVEQGTMFLLLTGGEPFLYPRFFELYEALVSMGLVITINTNGTLLKEADVKRLSQNKPRRVNITLYGASNQTYHQICHNPKGFDETIKSIELLKKYGIDVKLNGTITPDNVEQIPELVQIAKEHEVPITIDTYLFPFQRSVNKSYCKSARLTAKEAAKAHLIVKKLQSKEEEWEAYQIAMKELASHPPIPTGEVQNGMTCRAGRSSFWITWKGEMLPCSALVQHPIAIQETGFTKAWEQVVLQTEQILSAKQCDSCAKQKWCMNCPGRSFCETGEVDQAAEYVCEYTESLMEEVMTL